MIWAVRNGLLDEWRRGLLWRLAAGAHCVEAAAAPAGGTTLTIPPTSSSSPASATGWSRGKGQEEGAEKP